MSHTRAYKKCVVGKFEVRKFHVLATCFDTFMPLQVVILKLLKLLLISDLLVSELQFTIEQHQDRASTPESDTADRLAEAEKQVSWVSNRYIIKYVCLSAHQAYFIINLWYCLFACSKTPISFEYLKTFTTINFTNMKALE